MAHMWAIRSAGAGEDLCRSGGLPLCGRVAISIAQTDNSDWQPLIWQIVGLVKIEQISNEKKQKHTQKDIPAG